MTDWTPESAPRTPWREPQDVRDSRGHEIGVLNVTRISDEEKTIDELQGGQGRSSWTPESTPPTSWS